MGVRTLGLQLGVKEGGDVSFGWWFGTGRPAESSNDAESSVRKLIHAAVRCRVGDRHAALVDDVGEWGVNQYLARQYP